MCTAAFVHWSLWSLAENHKAKAHALLKAKYKYFNDFLTFTYETTDTSQKNHDEKGQYFLSLISESETHILWFITQSEIFQTFISQNSVSRKIWIFLNFYAFSRRFYPNRLTVHSGYTFSSVCAQTQWTITSRWHGSPNHHRLWKLHTGLQEHGFCVSLLFLQTLGPWFTN